MKNSTVRRLNRTLLAALLGVISVPALAGVPAFEDNPAMLAGAAAQVATEVSSGTTAGNTGEIASSTAQMASLLQSYTQYMEGGSTGSGIIELLSAQGNQQSKLAAFNDQYFANLSQTNRADQASIMAAQNAMAHANAISLTSGAVSDTPGCEAVGASMTAGGAAAASRDSDNSTRAKIEDRMTNNRNPLAVQADLVAQRALFCSQYDVDNKRPGCSSVGALPNADIDSNSLTTGAVNKAHPSPTNHTFTADQELAATAYIQNVLPLQAPQPQGAAMNTAAGKQAMIEFQRYNARWSPISESLSAIKAMDAKLPKAPKEWNDGTHTGAYGDNGRIFPGMLFPAAPSEREVLYYQTYEAYQDPKKSGDWENMTGDALVREQLHLQALQARLQLLTVERTEEQNKLLAALLADRLDPVNIQTVKSKLPASAIAPN